MKSEHTPAPELLEALEFYSNPDNFLYFEGSFIEYGDSNVDLTQYNKMGTRAKNALARAKGEIK